MCNIPCSESHKIMGKVSFKISYAGFPVTRTESCSSSHVRETHNILSPVENGLFLKRAQLRFNSGKKKFVQMGHQTMPVISENPR